ncbi:MAG: right-handed parallel beta-helix repeat-containing protein [Nanoarchaeota archaeon]|nr:right-handed parallel beta-helix repeat-containing protein [Nanoarchaeota archaeon]
MKKLLLFVVALLAIQVVGAARCGDIVIGNETVTEDLHCFEGIRLAHGASLDCQEHWINGDHAMNNVGITIVGNQGQVRNCNLRDFGVAIQSQWDEDIVIEDVTIETSTVGIGLSRTVRTVIQGVTMKDVGRGIWAVGANDLMISDGEFDTSETAVRLEGSAAVAMDDLKISDSTMGVNVIYSGDIHASGLEIKDTDRGVVVSNSEMVRLSSSKVANSKFCVEGKDSRWLTLENSVLTDCLTGINIKGSNHTVISGNFILDSESFGIDALRSEDMLIGGNMIQGSGKTNVLLSYDNKVSIHKNIISNANFGIFIANDDRVKLTQNLIRGHKTGVWLDSSGKTSVMGNIMQNNLNDLDGYKADALVTGNHFYSEIPFGIREGIVMAFNWLRYPIQLIEF